MMLKRLRDKPDLEDRQYHVAQPPFLETAEDFLVERDDLGFAVLGYSWGLLWRSGQ